MRSSSFVREGDFYQLKYFREVIYDRTVEFIQSSEDHTVITRITVYHYKNNTSMIIIHVLPDQYVSLLQLSQKLCNVESVTYNNGIKIPFNSSHDMSSLLDLFHHFNNQFEFRQFTSEIELEIKQISDFLHRKLYQEKECRHIIPLFTETFMDPHLKHSKEIHKFLFAFDYYKKDVRQLILLLMHGENPNQRNVVLNETPCHEAVTLKSTLVLQFLLNYGGNPFLRNCRGKSALDVAKDNSCFDHVQLIIKFFSKLRRSPSKITIQKIDVSAYPHLVNTDIHLSDESIISTYLTSSNRLTLRKLKPLFLIFSKYFNTKDNKESFVEALSGKNKLVEWIVRDKQIIGFNFFEIIFLPKFKNKVTLHCQYSALDPQFRHLGIASLTAFRLAFALQQILPHSASFYFNAISPKSWHLIKSFLAFPQYQSPHVNQYVEALVNHTYGDEGDYCHEGLVCYVKNDSDQVKESLEFSINNFLYWFMCGLVNKEGIPVSSQLAPRAVPCFYEIVDDNLHSFLKMISLLFDHGVSHFKKIAAALNASSLVLPKPAINKIFFPHGGYSFFRHEIREPANPHYQSHHFIRSRL